MVNFNTGNPLPSLDERDFYDNSANFDLAMNSTEPTFRDRFGVEKPTIDAALKSAGFMPAGFDFVTGGTLQPGDRNKAVYNPAPNGDNNWYRWNGAFPKEIAANSQPNPKDENNWVSVLIEEQLKNQVRESIRNDYSLVGLTLVEGSFESGALITSFTDVVLHEKTGKCYSGPIGPVTAGSNPIIGGFVDRSDFTPGAGILRDKRFSLRDFVSVMDYGAKGDGVTDDSTAIQNAVNEHDSVLLPAGYVFKLKKYVSLKNNQTILINGTVLQGISPTGSVTHYHEGGFDAELCRNVLITGTGTLSSEGFVSIPDADFIIHKFSTGYCPIIHLRGCSDSVVENLNVYKVPAGIASTICDRPSQPNWDLVPIPNARGRRVFIRNNKLHFASLFGATFNTVTDGELSGNYCYRCGDSGLHIQFSRNINVVNNIRISPYGDGGAHADGHGILAVNDAQGLSIENSHCSLVQGNIVKGFAGTGIDVKNNSTNILVQGNYIQDCQLTSITARGGDAIYGLNTAITIMGNLIKNTGYLHSSDPTFINHPYKGGIFVQDTYSCFIKDNCIVGHNYKYGSTPIKCVGVNFSDLGFWGGTVSDRISYTKLVIKGNIITFPAFRTNYPDVPTNFLLSDCLSPAIAIVGGTNPGDGLWGEIDVSDNSLLGHKLSTSFSGTDLHAAIFIEPTGGDGAGAASAGKITVKNNNISYWPAGGISVQCGNMNYQEPTVLTIEGNEIIRPATFGIKVANAHFPVIGNNRIHGGARNPGGVSKSAIYLLASRNPILRGNTVTVGETKHAYAVSSSSTTFYALNNVFQTGSLGVYNGGDPISITGSESTGSNIVI